MVALDVLAVTTALSTIRAHVHAWLAGLEWTVNAYVLSLSVLLMTGAALGDRLVRRAQSRRHAAVATELLAAGQAQIG